MSDLNNSYQVNLKKIIGINTGKFAYCEVPIDENLLLIGAGNIGKSSMINTVRFFLLPDLSLTHAKRQFAFAGGKKSEGAEYYSTDEVAAYYFPSETSCLILEVEHVFIGGGTQTHCQILTMGSNYRLERTFIPRQYADIEHLFWNKQVESESGVKPTNPPRRQLLQALKQIDKATVSVRNQADLIKHLYSVNVLDPASTPYVVYPLQDTTPASLDSLRALIKLLFNQDSKSLRQMLSVSIDHQQSQQQLEVSIDSVIKEQELIKAETQTLEALSENQDIYKKLDSRFQKMAIELELKRTLSKQLNASHALSEKLNVAATESLNKKREQDKATSVAKKTQTDYAVELKVLARQVANREADLKKCSVNVDRLNDIINQYPGMSTAEIVDCLDEFLQETQLDLKNISDKASRERSKLNINNDIEATTKRINTLSERIAHSELLIKNQLPEQQVVILQSLNPKLTKAKSAKPLTDAQLTTFSSFCSMFKQSGSDIHYFDERFLSILEPTGEQDESLLFDAQATLKSLQNDLQKLVNIEQTNSPLIHQSTERQLEREIASTKNDIELFSKRDYWFQHQKELEKQLDKERTELEDNQTTFNRLNDAWLEEKEKLDGLDSEHADKSSHALEFEQELAAILNQSSFIDGLNDLTRSEQNVSDINADLATCKQLVNQIRSSHEAFNELVPMLLGFYAKGLIADEYGVLAGEVTRDLAIKAFTKISEVYQHLDHRYDQLKNDTQIHNSHVRNRLELLDKTHLHIENSVAKINADLSEARVNDLHGIKMDVTINSAFEALVQSWRDFDDTNPLALLPESWYARLVTFTESDAVDKDARVLRMEHLIQKVDCLTRKKGEQFVKKSQSTSTESLISLYLVEIFLPKLCGEVAQAGVPLMLDEAGTISPEQLPLLVSWLESRKGSIIGATQPGKSSLLTEPFGNFLIMDELRASRPYDAARTLVCVQPEREYIRPVKAKVMQEDQLCLLGTDIKENEAFANGASDD